jgi:hypothetical protein
MSLLNNLFRDSKLAPEDLPVDDCGSDEVVNSWILPKLGGRNLFQFGCATEFDEEFRLPRETLYSSKGIFPDQCCGASG